MALFCRLDAPARRCPPRAPVRSAGKPPRRRGRPAAALDARLGRDAGVLERSAGPRRGGPHPGRRLGPRPSRARARPDDPGAERRVERRPPDGDGRWIPKPLLRSGVVRSRSGRRRLHSRRDGRPGGRVPRGFGAAVCVRRARATGRSRFRRGLHAPRGGDTARREGRLVRRPGASSACLSRARRTGGPCSRFAERRVVGRRDRRRARSGRRRDAPASHAGRAGRRGPAGRPVALRACRQLLGSPVRDARDQPRGGDVRGVLGRSAGRLRLRPLGPFAAGPLAGVGLESVRAAGFDGTAGDFTRSRLVGTLGAGGSASWRSGHGGGAAHRGGKGEVPLAHPSFWVDEPAPPNSLLFRLPPAAVRALLGADASF